MKYRAEIDGLRTFAVIPVILFHAGVPFFSGGFVGVDIFFVISGFLITSIIVKDLDGGVFSIRKFYDRRLRRILPALLFVLLWCIPFAWLWMLPDEFSIFSGSIISVILSVSNIFFYRNIDYFSPSAESMPLLHTWSLGVEEQFYVFFPLLMMALWRFDRRRAFVAVLAISIVSLIWAEFSQRTNAMASFFLLPSRAWELGAGALAALWGSRNSLPKSQAGSSLGLAMITASVIFYNDKTPFPSIYALLPVVGTVLVLLCTAPETLAHRLLTWRPMVGIGLVSYSAYLWHQPLFAFARIRMADHPSLWIFLVLSFASLVLAYLSWRYIEAPFRRAGLDVFKQKRLLAGGAAVLTSFVAFGAIGAVNGLPDRMPASANNAMAAAADRGKYRQCLSNKNLVAAETGSGCWIGAERKGRADFLVIGDSFATALADGLDVAARNADSSGILYVANSCPAIIGLGGAYKPSVRDCERVQKSMVDVAKKIGVSRVYLVSNWRRLSPDLRCSLSAIDCTLSMVELDNQIAQALQETIRAFNAAGVTPVFIGTPPRYKSSVYAATMKQIIHDGAAVDLETGRADQYPEYLQTALRGQVALNWSYVDISTDFCDERKCKFSQNGIPAYWDSAHITASKAKELGASLETVFKQRSLSGEVIVASHKRSAGSDAGLR